MISSVSADFPVGESVSIGVRMVPMGDMVGVWVC
jgi:hypothetical protein